MMTIMKWQGIEQTGIQCSKAWTVILIETKVKIIFIIKELNKI